MLETAQPKSVGAGPAQIDPQLTPLHEQVRVAVVCLETPLHATLLSIEPFRAANRLSKTPPFEIVFIAVEGDTIETTIGISIPTSASLDTVQSYDVVLLHSCYEYNGAKKTFLFRWLRKHAASGAHIAAFDIAPILLAEAGLLEGYKATSHWSTVSPFQELYPNTDVVEQLFIFDRNRSTSAGQIASLDHSMSLLARFCEPWMIDAVANEIAYPVVRESVTSQRKILNSHGWQSNSVLERAQKLMQSTIEEPLSIGAIATKCGVSKRELQYLFSKHLKDSPKNCYMTMRLQRARELLLYSSLSVRETGLASGFDSSTTYFRAFRTKFLATPSKIREQFKASCARPDGRRLY